MKQLMNKNKLEFIEEMARTCEQTFGLPRMGGRIWAALLMTEKEHLSSEELMDVVSASRGTVSTMVRMLERVGFIRRITIRGDRKHYYSAAGAESLMHAELGSIKLFIRLMERGAKGLPKSEARCIRRLDDIRDMMTFFEKEYTGLLERWQQQRKRK